MGRKVSERARDVDLECMRGDSRVLYSIATEDSIRLRKRQDKEQSTSVVSMGRMRMFLYVTRARVVIEWVDDKRSSGWCV